MHFQYLDSSSQHQPLLNRSWIVIFYGLPNAYFVIFYFWWLTCIMVQHMWLESAVGHGKFCFLYFYISVGIKVANGQSVLLLILPRKKTFFSVFNLIKTSRSIYVKSEFSQKMKSFWEKSTIFFAISKFDIYFVYDLYVNNSCKDMILLCFNFHFSTSKFPMKLNNERPFLILIIKRKYRLKKTLDFFARSSSRSYLKQKKLLLLNGFQINAISHNNCWEMYW